MSAEYPQDADGKSLRLVAEHGSDMSKPMYIDFQIAVPDEKSANQLAIRAQKLGYRVEVYDSAECSLPWTTQCSTRMLATYDNVIAIQNELAELSRDYGGHPDGWGTYGNGPTGQPDAE
ncbi:MAG: ribonuclease E inhibitor RraB [Planctomycetota bacterium]